MSDDGITDQPDGATLIDDISGLLIDVRTRSELDDAELINISYAADWVKSTRLDVFTVAFYTELHRRMFDDVWGWAGDLRTQTGSQVGEPFARAEDVARELGEVAYSFHTDWNEQDHGADDEHGALVSFLARYHHALVLVHPFNNGNGRWSRLATDAVLQRLLGRPPFVWATNEATLLKGSNERSAYLKALHSADAHDFNALNEYLKSLNPGL